MSATTNETSQATKIFDTIQEGIAKITGEDKRVHKLALALFVGFVVAPVTSVFCPLAGLFVGGLALGFAIKFLKDIHDNNLKAPP